MQKFVTVVLWLCSVPAWAQAEKLTCFDVHSSDAFEVSYNSGDLRVEFTDLVSKAQFYATGDIFGVGPELPLYLSTDQLDNGGREMMAEACRLNPTPKAPVVNVMLWSGKVDGTTPIADRCFTCIK